MENEKLETLTPIFIHCKYIYGDIQFQSICTDYTAFINMAYSTKYCT